MKYIAQWVNAVLSKDQNLEKKILQEANIAINRKVYGPIRALCHDLSQTRSSWKASRMYSVLKLYTGIHIPLTEEGIADVVSTITHPKVEKLDETINDITSLAIKAFFTSKNTKLRNTLINKLSDTGHVNSYSYVDIKINRTRQLEYDLRIPIEHKNNPELLNLNWLINGSNHFTRHEIFNMNDRGSGIRDLLFVAKWFDEEQEPEPAAITVIPKPGAAGRPIAKISLGDQLLMQPFHNIMEDVRKVSPIFCWKDQQSMVDFTTRNIRYYSTDLSSATDTLPLNLFIDFIDKFVNNVKRSNLTSN